MSTTVVAPSVTILQPLIVDTAEYRRCVGCGQIDNADKMGMCGDCGAYFHEQDGHLCACCLTSGEDS